jgi:predicted transposase/invertase (TIGR01784 family)
METRNKNSFDAGRTEGEKLGIEKGKLETAKNMKRFGIDLPSIVKITGLTKEEIEKL